MNVPNLLTQVGEWLAVVELQADGQVVVRECSENQVPIELLDTLREHKRELADWLAWEQAAEVLWRAVFRRLSARADLARDTDFQAHLATADVAHLRHDRKALVDALVDLEAYARSKEPELELHDQMAVTP